MDFHGSRIGQWSFQSFDPAFDPRMVAAIRWPRSSSTARLKNMAVSVVIDGCATGSGGESICDVDVQPVIDIYRHGKASGKEAKMDVDLECFGIFYHKQG